MEKWLNFGFLKNVGLGGCVADWIQVVKEGKE